MKLVTWFLGLSKKTRIITAIIASTAVVGTGVGVGVGVAVNNHQKDKNSDSSYVESSDYVESSENLVESSTDSSIDSTIDSSIDSTIDSSTDSSIDSSTDSSTDSSVDSSDGTVDSSSNSGEFPHEQLTRKRSPNPPAQQTDIPRTPARVAIITPKRSRHWGITMKTMFALVAAQKNLYTAKA